ncbi:hypothetical protein OIU92_04215 [Escherichia coli]|nr:hypothetical protein [Escherichia coli]
MRKAIYTRDIKPFNVLRFSDGTYKVSDFGLVKDTNPEGDTTKLTEIGTRMGSTRYMAPRFYIMPSIQLRLMFMRWGG